MKKIALLILALLSFAVSFAQQPPQLSPQQGTQQAPAGMPQQSPVFAKFQELYDSLTPQQKNMFFTEVKHVYE